MDKQQEPIEINGRKYPLWSQFVQRKDEWIGGILQETHDSFPDMSGGKQPTTKITNITLEPNGETSAYFTVIGKNFSCGGDARVLGVVGEETGWITLQGYGGHEFRIKERENEQSTSEA